jgi:hypothetical protein
MAAAAAAAAAAARMNSTPVSDEELDMDDSVSLSSNQDGSCTSPSAPRQEKVTGNFKLNSNCFELELLELKINFFRLNRIPSKHQRRLFQFGQFGIIFLI